VSPRADDAVVQAAIDAAFRRLEECGGDFARLEDRFARTLVLVVSAQGVIENGGVAYFLGPDWPGNPPYELFVDAFREIGAHRAATLLAEALARLGVDRPERDSAGRRRALEGSAGERVRELDESWPDLGAELAAYVARRGPAPAT
jgi:hypothetical protein